MKYDFAPMEGLTGYVYRNAHHQFFHQVDQYYTPFVVPNQNRSLTSREMNDICPEHNAGVPVVPQIMSNRAEDFIWAAEKARELGYGEVNLNLGCPSGTVVPKKRGAGFLAYPQELDAFLDQVCQILEKRGIGLSVKTRTGKDSHEEFPRLLEIFNRYPIKRLIIHPRIQTDYYNNTPNREMFAYALQESKIPLCYNGDLFSQEDLADFERQFPQVERVMIGRGFLANPALAEGRPLDKQRLKAFHDTLEAGYEQVLSGDRSVLFKLKELWNYLGCSFADFERYRKKIKKAQHLSEYRKVVEQLFEEQELSESPGFTGYRK